MNNIKRMRNERGFTLIELLVVIVILGILAAVVVFAVGGLQDKGQEDACKVDKKTLATAMEAYFSQNDAYPVGANDAAGNTAIQTALTPNFISDPSTLHTVASDADGPYTITGVGKCA